MKQFLSGFVSLRSFTEAARSPRLRSGALACATLLTAGGAVAQVNVTTAHNDNARTGQNVNETILTPSNVNPTQFGQIFTQQLGGGSHGQPLYVSNVTIPGKGTHNVVYVALDSDFVYAFDADTNGGTNSTALWRTWLRADAVPAGSITNLWGVGGTPVIDLPSKTMYLISGENQNGAPIFRMHALDITTGAEKFGGPVTLSASVAGTGSGSTGGVLNFDASVHFQRPGLLYLNGVVYAAFGSISDNGPWHGWIFSFAVDPTSNSLKQVDAFCFSPNSVGAGIWMGGAGLAAEVQDPSKPFGRMFVATGNGSVSLSYPYDRTMSYGMSLLNIDLSNGHMTVEDSFTPFNQATLDASDGDLGSGGPVILPTQTMASGKILHPILEIGKSGLFYILDRDTDNDGSNNSSEYSPAGLGGYDPPTESGGPGANHVVQQVQTPITNPRPGWGAGVWGTEAYWNGNIYSGGTSGGKSNSITAYSFLNGVLSASPTSVTPDTFVYAGPIPTVSANGKTDGIVWALRTGGATQPVPPGTLYAYDATDLSHQLYASSVNAARDNPGVLKVNAVPTIANGKVYVVGNKVLGFYGLLGSTPTAAVPVITPGSKSFTGTQTITITDATPGATIYYTTDGTVPTADNLASGAGASPIYKQPLTIAATTTISAIASVNKYLLSPPVSASYILSSSAADPVFSLAAGTYAGTQKLTISDTTAGAVIHYTMDGSAPTTSSPIYTQPLSVAVSETVSAIAVPTGSTLTASSVVTAAYIIVPPYAIDFTQGFAAAEGPISFNGSTGLDDFRLQLTNGGKTEAGSAFYTTPVNIQQFTTDFTFQLSNPAADGVAFVIQNVNPTALGGPGQGLGYATIPKSAAIKFDIYSNAGEGPNSTGLFFNGVLPTVPSIDLTASGIDLHNGNYKNVHITYDGVTLSMTITDPVTLASFSTSWQVDLPAKIGSNTAYVGFTGGTGGLSASQKFTSWTYLPGAPGPNYPAGFDSVGLTLNGGATLNGTRLRITDGQKTEARSAFFTTPVDVEAFTTSFQFQGTNANADGFTFAIQGVSPTALGGTGGGLGYGADPSVTGFTPIGNSLAIKFDLCNNQGEGNDSTGLYIDGATPTVPSTNLTSSGINFHNGNIFTAQLTYDGATLTVVITDTVTKASATQSYTVNIPSIVGGGTAYIGFTGGSGGLAAIQEITNWTYTVN